MPDRRQEPSNRTRGRLDGGLVPAPFLIVGAALSAQAGAGLAVRMIDRAGPLASVWLRLAFGAALMAVLRPA